MKFYEIWLYTSESGWFSKHLTSIRQTAMDVAKESVHFGDVLMIKVVERVGVEDKGETVALFT